MTEVSQGADVERLLVISGRLGALARRSDDVLQTGNALMVTLQGSWAGRDREHYAQGWSAAGSRLAQASSLLAESARRLQQQADAQHAASQAGGAPRGAALGLAVGSLAGAAAGAEVGSEADAGQIQHDNNDARDSDSWIIEMLDKHGFFDLIIDQAAEDVTLPPGADPDDPEIREMLATRSGRETLDWMARNGISIQYNPGAEGARYDPNDNVMIIGEGGSESIIHEAEHARHDAEDLTPSVTEVDREEYVDTMLDLEVDCEVARVEYIQEMREIDPSYASGNRSVETYEQAYDAAVADGSSPEEAEAAGHEAIKQLYLDGEYVQSSDEQPYDESYGEFWDSRN